MVTITTDSTADLTPDLAQKRGIKVIPLSVTLNGKIYRDGLDLTTAQLFSLISQTRQLPTTTAPSVGEFVTFFASFPEVIHLSISAKLSASYQNAMLAAQELGNPHLCVLDTLNLSSGIAWLALKAADLRDQGCSLAEIEGELRAWIPKVRTAFVPETLEYLYKGGRCTAVQALMGSMLKILPIIHVQADGTLGVGEKARGRRQRALQTLLEGFERQLDKVDRGRIFVTHAACPQDAQYLAGEIQRLASPQELIINEAGCVISSHCGPGTIGIIYALK
ncbi:MAG: DegV family protein [Anaerolineae bacterium]|jgi:DegV family protein with EDD domain|nr:MAG: DegV family protein [Anaerolineae bacterium]